VPEAENCCEVPLAILAVDGDVEMVATGDVVSVAEPVIPLNVAEIVAAPGAATADARPEVLIPAMPVSDEAQVAQDVRFCSTLLASVPSAENCCVIPGAMLFGFAGDRDSETAADVVSTADPVMPLYTAVMTVEPVDVPVAKPALTVAIPGSDELHVANVVRFSIFPFEYDPMAVNCAVVEGAMLGPGGLTAIDLRVAGAGGVSPPPPPPHPMSITVKIIPAIVAYIPLCMIFSPFIMNRKDHILYVKYNTFGKENKGHKSYRSGIWLGIPLQFSALLKHKLTLVNT
jgi:hypothetical protein